MSRKRQPRRCAATSPRSPTSKIGRSSRRGWLRSSKTSRVSARRRAAPRPCRSHPSSRPSQSAPSATAVEPSAHADASARSPRFYAGISLAAVGAAAMLTSIATGVLTKKREQELEDKCDGRSCDASLKDTADSGQRLARTTDALLFGGIALAGAGAALLVFGGLERSTPQAARRPQLTRRVFARWLRGAVHASVLRGRPGCAADVSSRPRPARSCSASLAARPPATSTTRFTPARAKTRAVMRARRSTRRRGDKDSGPVVERDAALVDMGVPIPGRAGRRPAGRRRRLPDLL